MSAKLIDLALGDPGYGPPASVLTTVAKAMRGNAMGYAPMGGLPALRRALAVKLAARNGIPANPVDIVVTSGASQALSGTLGSLCAPGDKVLIPAPGFPLYRLTASTLHLTVADYPLDETTGEPDWQRLNEASRGARILIWNYPSNPLGTVARADWMPRLANLLDESPDLLLISDEVYEDLCYDAEHITTAAALPDELRHRVLSLYSFSKSYGMAGWRVGYVHAPGGRASGISRYQWAASMSASTPGQVAALAALACGADPLRFRAAELKRGRDLAVDTLRTLKLRLKSPSAGMYCWFSVHDTGLSGDAFVTWAAHEARVLLASGSEFGPCSADRVRLSFAAAPNTLAEAMTRLVTAPRW